MAKSGQTFNERLSQRLPGVPKEQWSHIRQCQPYRRGDTAKAMRWLRNLSDMDKHRVLVPAVANQSGVRLRVMANWPIFRWEDCLRQPRALKVGAPVLKLGLRREGTEDCEVQVNGNLFVYPSLGRGVPVGQALALIDAAVLEILTVFDETL